MLHINPLQRLHAVATLQLQRQQRVTAMKHIDYERRRAHGHTKRYNAYTIGTPWLYNGIQERPPKHTPPLHTDYQPPEIATPTPIQARRRFCVTDDTHRLVFITATITYDDDAHAHLYAPEIGDIIITPIIPRDDDTYTYDGYTYTGAELWQVMTATHGQLYTV